MADREHSVPSVERLVLYAGVNTLKAVLARVFGALVEGSRVMHASFCCRLRSLYSERAKGEGYSLICTWTECP